MEGFGDQLAGNDGTAAVLTLAGSPVGGASNFSTPDDGARVGQLAADAGLAAAIASVNAAAASAPGTLAMAGYVEAADFAGLVEDLSRTVDYLQILAADAVNPQAAPGSGPVVSRAGTIISATLDRLKHHTTPE